MKKVIIPILALLFISIAFTTTTSCTKECDPTTIHDSTTINNYDTVTLTNWTLQYFEGSAGNNTFYAPGSFIKNGKATFASNLFHQNYWFSEYSLPIPKEINLNLDTDSLKIVANLRNINGDGNSHELDLGINSDINLYAVWQNATSYYNQINIGSQKITDVNEHVTNTGVYAEYALQVQNNTVSTLKNNTVLKTVSHTGSRGGRVKYINVAFRGYGEVDWVKLYKGNKLIMVEDFNVDGTTTAIWSKP